MKILKLTTILTLSLFAVQLFAAEPIWIWKSGKIKTERANFKKSFTLDAKPKEAALIVTCDNGFKLVINGKPVASSTNWEAPIKKDIASFFKAGKSSG